MQPRPYEGSRLIHARPLSLKDKSNGFNFCGFGLNIYFLPPAEDGSIQHNLLPLSVLKYRAKGRERLASPRITLSNIYKGFVTRQILHSTLHALTHLNFALTNVGGTSMIPILPIRKSRLREVKLTCQDHRVEKERNKMGP